MQRFNAQPKRELPLRLTSRQALEFEVPGLLTGPGSSNIILRIHDPAARRPKVQAVSCGLMNKRPGAESKRKKVLKTT